MISATVTIRSADARLPPFECDGFVPFADSPLAVTRDCVWDGPLASWRLLPKWQITQRSTGFNLGARTWPTREAAMAVLLRCDPTFAAWAVATGKADDTATVACRVKFRMAQEV